MKRLSIFTTWAVFVAYSSLLIGGAHGAVLCLGENGHIAIEAAQNGDCNGFLPEFYLTDPSSHKPVFSGTANQHCGPCVDFDLSPMYSYRMTTPLQKKSSPLQQKISFSGAGQALFSETPQTIILPPEQFSKYLSAALLRTMVLLI
jgi:hypothetical protein